jgi:hypothetical protein
VVWFVRSILCFAHGLVYPGCFLFCEWSGLSGPFSVLRMVWFIRAIFCIARGLIYPGHSLYSTWSGFSGLFSVLRWVWFILAILCFAHVLVYPGHSLRGMSNVCPISASGGPPNAAGEAKSSSLLTLCRSSRPPLRPRMWPTPPPLRP